MNSSSGSSFATICKVLFVVGACAIAGGHVLHRFARIADAEAAYQKGSYARGTTQQSILNVLKAGREGRLSELRPSIDEPSLPPPPPAVENKAP